MPDIEMYQGGGGVLHARRLSGDGLLVYHVDQSSGLIKGRIISSTEGTSYHIDESEPIPFRRVVVGGEVIWVSGEYIFDFDDRDAQLGMASRDRTEPDDALKVFRVTPAGDITAQSITVLQRAPGNPALTLKRGYTGAQVVFRAEDETAHQIMDLESADTYTICFLSAPVDEDNGVVQIAFMSPVTNDVMRMGCNAGVDSPNHAAYIWMSDDALGGQVELSYMPDSILSIRDRQAEWGAAIDLAWMPAPPSGGSSHTRLFLDEDDGWLKTIHSDDSVSILDDIWRIKKLAEESVTTNTTPQDDNHLFFDGIAGGIYQFKLSGIYMAGTGSDIKVQMAAPGDALGGWSATSVGGTQGFNNAAATGSALNAFGAGAQIFGGAGAAAYTMFELVGTIEFVNAGRLILQWAQGTSSGTTKLLKGSVLCVEQVDI